MLQSTFRPILKVISVYICCCLLCDSQIFLFFLSTTGNVFIADFLRVSSQNRKYPLRINILLENDRKFKEKYYVSSDEVEIKKETHSHDENETVSNIYFSKSIFLQATGHETKPTSLFK